MHGAAGLIGQGLRHEGGIDVVAHGGLAHRALEEEGLVGQHQGIAMVEVDLHLRRPGLMGQRVDVDLLRLAEIVDILEDGIELIGGVDAIGLAPRLRPARAPDGRQERQIGIGIDLHQEEFELRRHHRLPAPGGVEGEDLAQHMAGGDLHRLAVAVEGIADHLGRRLRVPGHDADGVRIGPQIHVRILVAGDVLVIGVLGILARHRLDEDALGQPQALVLQALDELRRRQDLAAGDAVDVGHQALDLVDLVLGQPVCEFGHDCGSGGKLRATMPAENRQGGPAKSF